MILINLAEDCAANILEPATAQDIFEVFLFTLAATALFSILFWVALNGMLRFVTG